MKSTITLVFLLATTTSAQVNWRTNTRKGPSVSADGGMVVDTARNRILLYGYAWTQRRMETWEWDGKNWKFLTAQGPAQPSGYGLAYDDARKRVVLFGYVKAHSRMETWEFDGKLWSPRTLAVSPPVTTFTRLAYLPFLQRVVAIAKDVQYLAVWKLDATKWTRIGISGGPTPRTGFSVAPDPTGGVLLFGGLDASWNPMADTWLLKPNGIWERKFVSTRPTPRTSHAMAGDWARKRVVLHGGTRHPLVAGNAETWEWDGSKWQERKPTGTGAARAYHSMVWDPMADRVLMYGGVRRNLARSLLLDDTMNYGAVQSAAFRRFGATCSPWPVTLDSTRRPWIGFPMSLRVSGYSIGTRMAIILTGVSRTQWGALKLPVDLSPLGMTGCRLFVSAELATGLAMRWGITGFSYALPLDRRLIGSRYYHQLLVFDMSANRTGLSTSNATELLVGGI